MNIDPKALRNLRLQYDDNKSELTETCLEIISNARFLGCVQREGKEDVKIALSYIEGFLRCLEIQRSNK